MWTIAKVPSRSSCRKFMLPIHEKASLLYYMFNIFSNLLVGMWSFINVLICISLPGLKNSSLLASGSSSFINYSCPLLIFLLGDLSVFLMKHGTALWNQWWCEVIVDSVLNTEVWHLSHIYIYTYIWMYVWENIYLILNFSIIKSVIFLISLMLKLRIMENRI